MLKGGETEQEEEGAGEVPCALTDLVFKLAVSSWLPSVPVHSFTWLWKAREGCSLDLLKAVTCVVEGIKVGLELFLVALSSLLMCHFSVLVCRLWRQSG